MQGQRYSFGGVGGDGDPARQQVGQGTPIGFRRYQGAERLQGLTIGGQALEQIQPSLLGALGLLEHVLGQASQTAQYLGLRRRIVSQGGDLLVQHARHFFGPSLSFVAGQQRLHGLRVAGNMLEHIFPVGNGFSEGVELVLQQIGNAPDNPQLFLRRGGIAEVVLKHLDQPRLVVAAFEDALQAQQRVPIAGDELENLRRRPGGRRQVVQALFIQAEQSAQQIDLLPLAAGQIHLAAQQGGQLGPLFGLFVGFHHRAERDHVLGIESEDFPISLGRPIGRFQFVQIQPGQSAQDLGPGARVAGGRFLGEKGRHFFPAASFLQDALARLACPLVAGVQLEHLSPRRQRAIHIAQLGFGNDGHFFQSGQQFRSRCADRPLMIERELQNLGQFAPGAALAEMLGIGAQRLGIAGLQLQDGMQVNGGLLAVAQAITIQGRQFAQQGEPKGGVGGLFQLLLAQLGQLAVVLPIHIELGQLLRGSSPRRLNGHDFLVNADGLGDIVERVASQVGPLEQHLDFFLIGVRRRRPLAHETIQVGQPARTGQQPLHQDRGIHMAGHGCQGLAQGCNGVFHVAGFLSTPSDLGVKPRGPLPTVRARPLGIGKHRGQGIQGLVVARVQAHHIAQSLRCLLQIADLLGQHASQPEHQIGATFWVGGGGQFQFIQATGGLIFAQGCEDLARLLDGLELIGRDASA